MRVLFTTTDKIVSKIIRGVLQEPVSHCAIKIDRWVLHSDFLNGVHVEPWSRFVEKNKIVHSVHVGNIPGFDSFLYKNYGKSYDYLGFLMLGIRGLLPRKWTKKQDINQLTGAFMCHEMVNQALSEDELTLLTPYKLYLKLTSND